MYRQQTLAKIDEHRRNRIAVADIVPDSEFGRLYEQVLKEYGMRCLWNCRPEPTQAGISVVAERLIKHGDLRAWHLAHQLIELSADAA